MSEVVLVSAKGDSIKWYPKFLCICSMIPALLEIDIFLPSFNICAVVVIDAHMS